MRLFSKVTLGIVVMGVCGLLNANPLSASASGYGCIINQSALSAFNQNSKQTVNIRLDSIQKGSNQKIISFAYDLNIPDRCSVNPVLTLENFNLTNQFENIELKDVRFVSGAKHEELVASVPGTIKVLVEYNVKNVYPLQPATNVSLKLNSVLSL